MHMSKKTTWRLLNWDSMCELDKIHTNLHTAFSNTIYPQNEYEVFDFLKNLTQ